MNIRTNKTGKVLALATAFLGTSTSAMAYDFGDTDLYGQVKVWYQTSAVDKISAEDTDLFDKNGAVANAALKLGLKTKVGENFKFNVEGQGLSTLGLENNLVSGVAATTSTSGQAWISQAAATWTPGKTSVSLGRLTLNTPLAYTENWNAAPNTFEALVIANSDIKHFTLIGAYVGKGNGQSTTLEDALAGGSTTYGMGGKTVATDGKFQNYVSSGAYAAGVLFDGMETLPVNLWYYHVNDVADALWVDASYKLNKTFGFGAQFAQMSPDGLLDGADDTTGFAVKVDGSHGKFSWLAAYSNIGEGTLPIANTATGFKKTKLYTAGIFTDGGSMSYQGVGDENTTAFKGKIGYKFDKVNLALQAVHADHDTVDNSVTEVDLIASTKLAGFNLKGIYIYRNWEDNLSVESEHRVRMIVSYDF